MDSKVGHTLGRLSRHDQKLIEDLLRRKGFRMAIEDYQVYAHPLIMALDWALTRSKQVTEYEFVLLNRELDRPVSMCHDWEMNVYGHFYENLDNSN